MLDRLRCLIEQEHSRIKDDDRNYGNTHLNFYKRTRFSRLRVFACLLLRLNLIGRPGDVGSIKIVEITRNKQYPCGVLWCCLRRQKYPWYRWEPVVGGKDRWLCPVWNLEQYLKYADRSREWCQRPRKDPHTGEYYSIWRSSTSPHHSVTVQTCSHTIKDIMEECGVDVTEFNSASVRGAAATAFMEAGVDPDSGKTRELDQHVGFPTTL